MNASRDSDPKGCLRAPACAACTGGQNVSMSVHTASTTSATMSLMTLEHSGVLQQNATL